MFCVLLGRQCPSLDTGPSGVPGSGGHGPITLILGEGSWPAFPLLLNCELNLARGQAHGKSEMPRTLQAGFLPVECAQSELRLLELERTSPFQVTSLMGVDCDSATGSFRVSFALLFHYLKALLSMKLLSTDFFPTSYFGNLNKSNSH